MTERGRSDPRPTPCRSRRHEHGATPPRVAPGLAICAECRERAEENLVELPELYEMCAYVLDLRRPQPRERVSGRRPHGIVLRDAVVTVRSDILGVLASWCGLVTSERGVAGPDELSIRRLTTFVQVHLTWLVAHQAAADFADELNELAEAAREVLTPDADLEFELGPCSHPGCEWTVRAEGHPPQRIRCDAGHEWPPEQWLLLLGRPDGHPNGNGHSNGHSNGNGNGNGAHQSAPNGHSQNGHAQNGHAQNGHSQNGHAQNGHAQNGHSRNGHANGHRLDSFPEGAE